MNLVRESKKKKLSQKKLTRTLLEHRWSYDIVQNSPCLDAKQEYDVIRKTAWELGLVHRVKSWIPDEHLAFGIELSSMMMCPSHLVEAAKMSLFVEHLLTNHNLNTLVAATLHSIQPNANNNTGDFRAVNMWYERLDKRYNFSLGPVVLPLLPSDNLTRLKILEPPYLKDYKHENMTLLYGGIKTFYANV